MTTQKDRDKMLVDSIRRLDRVRTLMAEAEERVRSSTPPVTAERLIADGLALTVTVKELREALEEK